MDQRRATFRRSAAVVLIAFAAALLPQPLLAQDEDYVGRQPPRIQVDEPAGAAVTDAGGGDAGAEEGRVRVADTAETRRLAGLPLTGAAVGLLAAVGAALTAAGVAAVAVARKRRPS